MSSSVKDLKQKKMGRQFVFAMTPDEEKCQYCKQIKLFKFAQIPFMEGVPHFVIDFFEHMTGLDFVDLLMYKQRKNQNDVDWSYIHNKIQLRQGVRLRHKHETLFKSSSG